MKLTLLWMAFIACVQSPLIAAMPTTVPAIPTTLPTGTTATEDAVAETPGVASWTVSSPFQHGSNKVEYLLPDRREQGRRYPVVYILPVNAGTHGDWGHPLVVARESDLANRFGIIIVTPAYNALPWFGDNPEDPEFRQSSYFTQVVIPLVETRLPAIAEPRGRYLVGFSKSALGALGIFLRQTDQFNKLAVFENYWGPPTGEQWQNWGFAQCYGTRENFDRWDPQRLIPEHATELQTDRTRIIVLSGKGKNFKPRLGVDALVGLFRDKDIPLQVIADDHWTHDWKCGWLPIAIASLMNDVPAATR